MAKSKALVPLKQPKLVSKAEFKRMSGKLRRLLVAKDVLAHLESKRMIARYGTYFCVGFDVQERAVSMFESVGVKKRTSSSLGFCGAKNDARAVLSAIDQCYVCARGAVVVAAIERFDAVDVYNDPIASLGEKARSLNAIPGVFAGSTLENMENVFERWAVIEGKRSWYSTLLAGRPPAASEKLRLLMKHIVRHGGDFKPDAFVEEMEARRHRSRRRLGRV